jgi:hypothetical protein
MTRAANIPNLPRRPIPIGTDQCTLPEPFTRPTLPPLPQYRRFPWDPMLKAAGFDVRHRTDARAQPR